MNEIRKEYKTNNICLDEFKHAITNFENSINYNSLDFSSWFFNNEYVCDFNYDENKHIRLLFYYQDLIDEVNYKNVFSKTIFTEELQYICIFMFLFNIFHKQYDEILLYIDDKVINYLLTIYNIVVSQYKYKQIAYDFARFNTKDSLFLRVLIINEMHSMIIDNKIYKCLN